MFLVVVQKFRENVLPNIEKLLSADYVRSVHHSGEDLRTHLINARKYLQCHCRHFMNSVI